MAQSLILVDDPAPMVRRITLNRPEKRNALNATLRREILTATRDADRDDSVRVTVIRGAGKCFSVPSDLVQINKRSVHRAMEVMGLRSSIRAGTELSALATHTESMKRFLSGIRSSGLRAALDERDSPFRDYRTSEPRDPG